MKILVTGGAGFIGCNFVRQVLAQGKVERIVNLDALTYAGSLSNLESLPNSERHVFVRGDICDEKLVEMLFAEHGFDAVINFAAESHVDRSISSSAPFVHTNVEGTRVLLDAALYHGVKRFVQISTDEVYGSRKEGSFGEESRLEPRSPYSATKAAADLLALSYYSTHGLDVVITRSTNNYGPYQHPEKFIPLFITNALQGHDCPLYGNGENVRDWLFVGDNCSGIWTVFEKGVAGSVYNIGGGNERKNADVARLVVTLAGGSESLIKSVADRKGHDFRYSVDCGKARALGWSAKTKFDEGLVATVKWYRQNEGWWRSRLSH
jgi:dTDP-glucose 4,6-dehydratase